VRGSSCIVDGAFAAVLVDALWAVPLVAAHTVALVVEVVVENIPMVVVVELADRGKPYAALCAVVAPYSRGE
jgi:hypothetical protein